MKIKLILCVIWHTVKASIRVLNYNLTVENPDTQSFETDSGSEEEPLAEEEIEDEEVEPLADDCYFSPDDMDADENELAEARSFQMEMEDKEKPVDFNWPSFAS